jgi:hypothetical protein
LIICPGRGKEISFGESAPVPWRETRVFSHLRPADIHLNEEIEAHRSEVGHANAQHLDFELAEVSFEVGIVLASVSIIAHRRRLLGAAGAAATAGLVLMAAGLLFA